jgi:hypothetical protein
MIKYITHIIGLPVKVVKISRTFDCFVYVVSSHFQQYFSYVVAVSFIGGGNRSIWRKPLTNFYHNVQANQ